MTPLTEAQLAWIERLFSRLTAVYGNRMRTMWADADPQEVKATWMAALNRYSNDDVRRALASMLTSYLDYPPTLPQFLNLCRDAQMMRAQQSMKIDHAKGVPCPPEVKAQLDALLKRITIKE